jgi:hypothetical protein
MAGKCRYCGKFGKGGSCDSDKSPDGLHSPITQAEEELQKEVATHALGAAWKLLEGAWNWISDLFGSLGDLWPFGNDDEEE